MSVIAASREAILQWQPAAPYELVLRAAALIRQLLALSPPVPHARWAELAQAVAAEHVVSFTTPSGRPHRVLLHTWWRITNDSEFIFDLEPEASDLVGVVVGLSSALLAHCPMEESSPDYVAPIPFTAMQKRLIAHLDMIAKLSHAPRPTNA
jgi:hypothetical protein